MKKLLAIIIAISFVLGLSTLSDAAAKKAVVKKAVKKVAKKAVKAPKLMLPPTVVPPPPPVVKPFVPAAPAAGMEIGGSAGYLTKYNAKDITAVTGLLQTPDLLGIGSMLGLGANDINYRVNGVYGISANSSRKVALVGADAILNLPKDLAMGIETYVGGGVSYGFGTSYKGLGYAAYAGAQADLLGIGGKEFVEVGYAFVNGSTVANVSGIGIMVGYKMSTSALGF